MGVNANQSPDWDLSLAVPSAHEAARLWQTRLRRDYADVVEVALDSDLAPDGSIAKDAATKANLQAVFDLLAGRDDRVTRELRDVVDPHHQIKAATPDDAVVLYIASHGYADASGSFYAIPYDTGTKRGITETVLRRCQETSEASELCQAARSFLGHAISSDDLARWWTGVDGGELVMVLDSCHSGAVPGKDFRAGPLGDRGFGQLSYDKGMRILAAAQPDKTERATMVVGHTLLVEA